MIQELSDVDVETFRQSVWGYYHREKRVMPWRTDPSPYKVLVSEVMLQQTQVARVIPKFEAFLERFPDIQSLSAAPLADVLMLWSGLGYNRRAKYLWLTARRIVEDYEGKVPDDSERLVSLPGIGPNTAGAIRAYAFNHPVSFIETNIRTVYLHHFFADDIGTISDRELREVIDRTRDDEYPREWHWALMDYGTHLKKTAGGRLSQSSHYRKQSPLAGSLREMRGMIIRKLTTGEQPVSSLRSQFGDDERYDTALVVLTKEGLIERHGDAWRLTAVSDTR